MKLSSLAILSSFHRLPLLNRCAVTFAAGALAALSYSPVNLWLAGLIAVSILYIALFNSSTKEAAKIGLSFGVAYFGIGTSWIYVSIYEYGNAGAILSALITILFIIILALFFMLQCWAFRKFASRHVAILGFAACWVLSEALRGWIFTGFPWLYLGSAHVTTLLSGIAPIWGVMGISFFLALSAAILGEIILRLATVKPRELIESPLCISLVLLWACAGLLTKVDWVTPIPEQTLSVGIVQGNIEQSLKFRNDELQNSLQTYENLSASLWHNDFLLWPETALPIFYQNSTDILQHFEQQALATDSALVTGIFYQEDNRVHNSVTVLGKGSGTWHKQKLVPFGEYTPFQSLVSNFLQLFNLPMASLSKGPAEQAILNIQGYQAAALICYEVVYPDFVKRIASNADFLLTISNDTWFGASWGPWQHLQIAAMRARELGRYMVRSTNDGVSAIINERGEILAQTLQFQEATLSGKIQMFSGHTPFSRWGSLPVLLLSSLIFLINFYPIDKKKLPLK